MVVGEGLGCKAAKVRRNGAYWTQETATRHSICQNHRRPVHRKGETPGGEDFFPMLSKDGAKHARYTRGTNTRARDTLLFAGITFC